MARKQKQYHYIYKTTCTVTGKYYIGMHSTDNLNDGYLGSGKRLWNSIKYHGKENHSIEILEHYNNREALRQRESELVNDDLLTDEMCMNLSLGGEGGIHNDEHGKKFHKAGGIKRASIHLEKIKNDVHYKDEVLNRLRVGLKNSTYDYKSFLNKTHSNETKELFSLIRKGTGLGKTNSQYGTCWITKDGVNKKIKKEELNTYLAENWIKGRSIKMSV